MEKIKQLKFKLKVFWYARPAALRAFIIMIGIGFIGFLFYLLPAVLCTITILFFVWYTIYQVIKIHNKYR